MKTVEFHYNLNCTSNTVLIRHRYSNYHIMGLLDDMGPIKSFQDSKQDQKALKVKGIRQFLCILKKYENWEKPHNIFSIKWGQEIQGHFLSKRQDGSLQLCKEGLTNQYKNLGFPLMFQYGSWMFEMTPKQPYDTTCNFHQIIESIRQKYAKLQSMDRIALTIPVIPFLGLQEKAKKKDFVNNITRSTYIDDDHIADHPRFKTLTKNIRTRRGGTVSMKVPLFIDENTDLKEISNTEPQPEFIHLDAMAFGMGLSCLQCTFSTKSLSHARYVFDQLHVFSPIFLALTAGSPFHKGKLADWDARWNIISGSVDDRTAQERDQTHKNYIPTSRYAQTNQYIYSGERNRPEYNDFDMRITNQEREIIKQNAKELGIAIDEALVNHIANIFKRDFLIVHEKFKEMQDDEITLFEMLNGTNWNSVRLKIPTDKFIGWRVQFRTMEIQLTADENAAYSLFIHMLARVLHASCDLNYYIPITKVRENFHRAHLNDAVRTQKFYFRTNAEDQGPPNIEQMTINQILFGKNGYKGMFTYVEEKLQRCMKVCPKVLQLVSSMKKFLQDTATGKRLTLAQWIRRYIKGHSSYKRNSILPQKTMDDLLITLYEISKGEKKDQNFQRIFNFDKKK